LFQVGEQYYCNGLAIGGLIKTKDNKYIFGKRTGKTIAVHNIDIIGGIVEDLGIKTGEELAKCNLKEIDEETNIQEEHIVHTTLHPHFTTYIES